MADGLGKRSSPRQINVTKSAEDLSGDAGRRQRN
jgi:hypothetical protein